MTKKSELLTKIRCENNQIQLNCFSMRRSLRPGLKELFLKERISGVKESIFLDNTEELRAERNPVIDEATESHTGCDEAPTMHPLTSTLEFLSRVRN